jgi:hypothetical protein
MPRGIRQMFLALSNQAGESARIFKIISGLPSGSGRPSLPFVEYRHQLGAAH